MKLEFSNQEIIWLYDTIGKGSDLDIGLNIYNRLKPIVSKLHDIKYYDALADEYQAKMFDARTKSRAIESEIK